MTAIAPAPAPSFASVVLDASAGPGHRVLDLTLRDARSAHALAASCLEVYRTADDPQFLDEAPVLAHDLPLTVRRLLNSARRDGGARVTVIRGNVVDQAALGATPGHWSEADAEASRVYGTLLVLYAALLGDVTGRATRQAGRPVTDVLPGPYAEDALSPYRPDWVGLFALRDGGGMPAAVAHVEVHRADVAVPTGAVCFVDNRDVAHGRDSLPAESGVGDRWLKRVDVLRDLRRTPAG
ncbi:Fe(II)-2OG oxygenase family protein [Streptomyces herbicida]|uniref:hypothetical protein n=1 Tax=Streptomyces herbicida TaxID=3065675 RepID=UPI0029306386|nr:hypothetical protein [Streptomyces sp. NEAU-HV9]